MFDNINEFSHAEVICEHMEYPQLTAEVSVNNVLIVTDWKEIRPFKENCIIW